MYRYLTCDERHALFEQEFRQAHECVGLTPEAQAQWLIEVGYRQGNFYDLSEGEVRALRWEMEAFLRPTPDAERGPSLGVTEDKAREWLGLIRTGVQTLAKGRSWTLWLARRYSFQVSAESNTLEGGQGRENIMKRRICEVLTAIERHLRRCQRPKCGRLFVANKRQRYCTPSCGWVTRTQRHRAKQRRAGVSGPA